ncbi:MAG: hypothetical protein ACRDSL_18420 [Pseudonocardiaceae bacterium]
MSPRRRLRELRPRRSDRRADLAEGARLLSGELFARRLLKLSERP